MIYRATDTPPRTPWYHAIFRGWTWCYVCGSFGFYEERFDLE
ncbi:MAG: hypothetical protein ACREA9_23235 [Pyrinomonadaceae bacterium]